MMKKTCSIVILLLLSVFVSGYKKPHVYKVDAEKNAYFHNNVGLNYLQDHFYYAAIQEFKIAISLAPETQASAVFYNNLGDVYMKIGHPELAEDCYINALGLYGLNLQYYINLAKCYKARNILEDKMQVIDIKTNPYNKILMGMMLIESGNKRDGIIMLDEFSVTEPDLIISGGIKNFIKNLSEE